MKEQMSSRKYEPSSASYHLTFFTVEKKGSDLRVIHDLQPLNAVTVQDATLPPHIDNMIESFSSRAIYGLFDLKSGYDSRVLTTISRYLTSFYVEGMGLQIRIFIWEYMKAVQELLARVQESGVTISGSKMVLATPHLQLLGAEVALDSAHISHEVTAKLAKWPTCQNPTEVCSFLGTVRVIRHWICDFAKIVKPLMALTKKMALHKFEWSEEAQDAMELLKHLATTAVPVRSLDYELACNMQLPDQRDNELGLVTVHVDSLTISVRWMITQHLTNMEYLIVFGSIMFNEHEVQYLQPKLELYGVFRALKAECHRLHNIHFRLTVDVGFLVQMMMSPDLPNAAMMCWITYIQLFMFEVNHTPGTAHCVPDGLSHWLHAADNSDYSDGDVNIEDGIKLVQVLPIEIESISSVEKEAENGIHVHEALLQSKLK